MNKFMKYLRNTAITFAEDDQNDRLNFILFSMLFRNCVAAVVSASGTDYFRVVVRPPLPGKESEDTGLFFNIVQWNRDKPLNDLFGAVENVVILCEKDNQRVKRVKEYWKLKGADVQVMRVPVDSQSDMVMKMVRHALWSAAGGRRVSKRLPDEEQPPRKYLTEWKEHQDEDKPYN